MRLFILFLLALAAGTGRAETLVADRPDHVLLARIECNVPGAEIWTVATNAAPTQVNQTPYVANVAFRWQGGFFGKKWKLLQVRTPGDLCQATYDKKTKVWTVDLACEVRAPGYQPARIERTLATFGLPKDLDWDDIDVIPDRVSVPVELTPISAAPAAPAARGPATVMLAGEQAGPNAQFGAVRLSASVPDAEVIVDGSPAGRTPVRLILRGGEHELTVQKPGYRAHQRKLSVSPDSEVSLQVTLEAAP